MKSSSNDWRMSYMCYAGPVPGHPNLYVAAGHEGSGLYMGPATAQMLVEYVEGPAASRSQDHVWQMLQPATRLLLAEP